MVRTFYTNLDKKPKLNRVYRLTVQRMNENEDAIDSAVVISNYKDGKINNGLTMKFQVNRSIFAEINGATVEIYNLSLETYRELFYDYFALKKRTVILEAGYEGQVLSVIFVGDLWRCYTSREGTETITRLECIVGWKSLRMISEATLENISRNQLLRYAANDMAMDIDIYSGEDTRFSRPVSIEGNSYGVIQKYSDHQAFIDNNKIIVLGTQDAIVGDVPLINDESGLLGVPEHEDAILKVNMIFEPRLLVGQIIEIKSRVAPMFNGQYKIYGIRHEGEISDAEAGKATTTLELLVGMQVYGKFNIKTKKQ